MAIWGGPWESNPTAHRVLVLVQFFSPVALMVVLILAFIYHGVTKSKSAEEDEPQPLGPGGKPLPRNLSPAAKAKKAEKELDFSSSRKWIFKILSICVLLTLVGNAAVVIVHALLRRRENWWCGQSFVVSATMKASPLIAEWMNRSIILGSSSYTPSSSCPSSTPSLRQV